MADFSVTATMRGGCCVLVLEGELDLAEAPTLDAALEACTDGLPVIVDLTSLTFLDSSGLHVLLRDREAGRPASVVRLPGSNVARVLDLVEATKAVRLYDDVVLAVDELGSGS
jgi:anti-sigma B factor antagonist